MEFEHLLALADAETLALAREFIGKQQLALLIAQAAVAGTNADLETHAVAKAFVVAERTAREKIDSTAFREVIEGGQGDA